MLRLRSRSLGTRGDGGALARSVLVVGILLAGTPSVGFEIDQWTSGMTVEQAREKARQFDLSFSPDCSHPSYGYDENRAMEGGAKPTQYCYFTVLAERPVWVRLQFEGEGRARLLESVLYRWGAQTSYGRESLANQVRGTVEGRYGRSGPCSPAEVGASLFGNDQCWNLGPDFIWLSRYGLALTLEFRKRRPVVATRSPVPSVPPTPGRR